MTDLTPSPDAFKLLMDGSKVFAQMERNGFAIDTNRLDGAIDQTEDEVRDIEKELQQSEIWTEWTKRFGRESNLASNPQLAAIVYDHLGFPCKEKTSKGQRSVSEKALQDVEHPFVQRLFDMRHLAKACNTFLKGLRREVVDGLVHSFLHLHTTVTYRPSSSDPNLFNLPKRNPAITRRVRRSMVSRFDRLFELDFKSAEVVTASVVTRDKKLLAYVTDKNKDMHRDCAEQLFKLDRKDVTKGIRNLAKQWFVFAQFYGDYYVNCAKNLWEAAVREKQKLPDGTGLTKHLKRRGIKEMGDCDPDREGPPRPGTFEAHVKQVQDHFWNVRFIGYRDWKKRFWEEYQTNGGFVTYSGFLVRLGTSGPLSKNECVNNPIQGPSFHLMLYTLIRLQRWLNRNKMKTLLINSVYDSAIGDAPEDELPAVLNEAQRIIREDLPKRFPWLTVPMSVEVSVSERSGNWAEMHEWLSDDKGNWSPAHD